MAQANTSAATQSVSLHDKQFNIYLPEEEILKNIKAVAERINADYTGKSPLFLAVLNGSFMFAADLMKELSCSCEISFIKLSSYQNMSSTGVVNEVIGLNESIAGRDVVVLEDIVDTGHTVKKILETLQPQNPASLEIASLLLKPDCLQHPLDIKYAAMAISNEFVVGYGLDYNGLGRNLKDIYKVME
ncbi:MAG: hypoxanthine phosphoribosyltransferase [Hymenobacteraceae bacterium]|nr:hypoxanthine phosphoribosyltransferase [Hymenobacteraceae bacterium]MDX5397182.1 hypoxanthine phosphoribosyltransferase [Hymenobacteraceae bacterium]MDX5513258.1 hypoxanthine phosphoribosyltransferase [Hymenobacteraceae bacterium]